MWGYGITGTRWGSWVTAISDFLSPGLDLVLADCEAPDRRQDRRGL